ncbi:SHOCT domain-containing protein [Allobranchiibius sp. CTAmp26]|uniref:SHOCT domain-containing protein n=1 Tax=Allobranchiibius sp. CTAmp26 TaxID=2815214 RepID=UPI001FB64597|nr:SHOCT domain-containing protein [Allobranchiibius sp. CTAmp26]
MGTARPVLNPNSKKARSAKANERSAKANQKMLKLQKAAAKQEATAQRRAAQTARDEAKGAKEAERNRVLAAQRIPAVPSSTTRPDVAAPAQPVVSVADELTKLAALRDSGVLTSDEFDTQKTRLLSVNPGQR